MRDRIRSTQKAVKSVLNFDLRIRYDKEMNYQASGRVYFGPP